MADFVRIPALSQRNPAVDKDGRFTNVTLRTLNDALEGLATAINAIAALPEIQAALAALDAATAAAQAAADNANAAATATTNATSLANSYVSGLTLTATDAGSSATITISAHTRVYGDGASVSVSGGSLTGLAYDTTYYIYYDQPSRAGGSVTYQSTTDPTLAAQTGDRHVVGSTNTPLAAGAPIDGNPVLPPGSGAILHKELL
jgi:hypothetical protein